MSGELIPHDGDDLEPIEIARAVIARAVADQDTDALLELRARAEPMALYHRRAGAKLNADEAGEIKVRAERGLGQIDRETNPHGRNQWSSGGAELLDVNHDTRAAWRKIGALADARFDAFIEIARADEEAGVSTERLIRLIRFGSTGSSVTFECYTPAQYIDAAREVLGGIDLDPASSAEANETVKAEDYFDADTDGLAQTWWGRVWLNPPYGRGLTSDFVTKAVQEFDADRVSAEILLLNAYGFDATWFRPLFGHVLCFTDHRIKFHGGGPTFGSLFVYLGPDAQRFAEIFAQFGHVVRRWP